MSDQSSNDADWVFYSDRPEWEDMKPVPQDDEFHVVEIAYSDKFKDIFNYFRAVLSSREISERALKLSEDASSVNPSNYTVWHYRRILLKELNKDLNQELEFVSQVIEDTPKNYQVWHHRQVLVEELNDASKEKNFTAKILANDPKNYHAWQHRQWVIRKFDLWDDELDFIGDLLEEDIRNNSAWNQRFFIINHIHDISKGVPDEEIQFTLQSISKAPNNESPWNYLRGILQDRGYTKINEAKQFAEELHTNGCRSPHLLAFLIDCYEEELLANNSPEVLSKADEICFSLFEKYDTIRANYWKFIGKNLQTLYGTEENSEASSGTT